MTRKMYTRIVAIVFFVISVLHLLRILFGWQAQVGGWEVPFWFSWIAVLFTGFLSMYGFLFGLQKGKE